MLPKGQPYVLILRANRGEYLLDTPFISVVLDQLTRVKVSSVGGGGPSSFQAILRPWSVIFTVPTCHSDFWLLTSDSHIPQEYQGRKPLLVHQLFEELMSGVQSLRPEHHGDCWSEYGNRGAHRNDGRSRRG